MLRVLIHSHPHTKVHQYKCYRYFFFSKNNMLTGKSKIQQALGYKALGRRLLLKYPKIHREDCTSKRRRKEELVSVTVNVIKLYEKIS